MTGGPQLGAGLALALAGCSAAAAPDQGTSMALQGVAQPGLTTRPGGVLTYQVGDARVLALLDARRPTPASIFRGLSEAEVARLLRAGGEATTGADGALARSSAIWCYLVEIGDERVLIDAGGAGLIPGAGGLAAGLDEAGVDPRSIDAIVITHMHRDHIGGLLDNEGGSRFPNATLHLDEAELAHWTRLPAAAQPAPATGNDDARTAEAVRRIAAVYSTRVRRYRGQIDIASGLSAEPLPGHTPGHRVYRLRSGGREVIFLGDMIHSLAVQLAHPQVTVTFDNDQARARASRLAFLERNIGSDALFAGSHFSSGVVSLASVDDRYNAAPVPADQ